MVKKHLTPFQKGLIQGEFAARHTTPEALSRKWGRSPTTIADALAFKDAPKIVRKPRAVSQHVQARRRGVVALADKTTLVDGKEYPVHCTNANIRKNLPPVLQPKSRSTICKDLAAEGMVSRVRKRVPTRDPATHAVRLIFCKGWSKPSMRNKMWRLCFSDEHILSVNDHTSRRMYVHKGGRSAIPRERKRLQNIYRIMVWACCGVGFKSELVLFPQAPAAPPGDGRKKKEKFTFRLTAKSYVRKCLSPVVGALAAQGRIFQQDGASPHGRGADKARATKFLVSKGVEFIKRWPPHSPDLNEQEHVWPLLNARVAAYHPTTLAQLKVAARKAWAGISQNEIDKICGGFRGAVDRTRKAGGRCV